LSLYAAFNTRIGEVLGKSAERHTSADYSSRLNQVELWFGKIERDVIARGAFTVVSDLKRKLMRYIRPYNKAPRIVKMEIRRSIPSNQYTISWYKPPVHHRLAAPEWRSRRDRILANPCQD
jgi:hypothetical protein